MVINGIFIQDPVYPIVTGRFSSSKSNMANIPQRRNGMGRLPGGSLLRKKRLMKKRAQFKKVVLAYSYGAVVNKLVYHYRVKRYMDDLIKTWQRMVERKILQMVTPPHRPMFDVSDFTKVERKVADHMASCHYNTQ